MGLADRVLRAVGLQRVRGESVPRRFRAGSWGGASTGRLFEDWYAGNFSADFEVRGGGRLLRARARELVRNDALAAGFLRELANNVVGPHGIQLQAKVTLTDGKTLAAATNREIERAFADWGNPETASADGQDGWIEQQRLMVQTMAQDGECFVRRLRGFDNPFGFALQFIDADLVDEYLNVPAGPGQNRIRMGVEVDRWNRPVAYHVWTSHGDEPGVERKRERLPASDVLHLFVRYRPNQTRGVTWFAPVLTTARHLAEYQQNHLVASRFSAANMGFIVNKHPAAIDAFNPLTPDGKVPEPRTFDVEAGVLAELNPGQEFQEYDPAFPSEALEGFTRNCHRAIAKGLGPSYFTLTGDTKEANFSSQRMAVIPERDWYRGLQVLIATKALRPIYRDWIGMALLSGALRVDTRLAADYLEVRWKGRGWAPIQPLDDAKAFEIWRKNGIKSRQDQAAEFGRDYEDIVDDLAYEEDYAADQDVDVSGEKPTGAAAGSPFEAERRPTPSDDTEPEAEAQHDRAPHLVAVTGDAA